MMCRGYGRCREPENRYAGATQLRYSSQAKDVYAHDKIGLRTAEWDTDFHLDS